MPLVAPDLEVSFEETTDGLVLVLVFRFKGTGTTKEYRIPLKSKHKDLGYLVCFIHSVVIETFAEINREIEKESDRERR